MQSEAWELVNVAKQGAPQYEVHDENGLIVARGIASEADGKILAAAAEMHGLLQAWAKTDSGQRGYAAQQLLNRIAA